MRIRILNHEYPPAGGGAATAAEALAVTLAARGHEVDVVTSALPGLPRAETRDGVRIARVETGRREAHRGGTIEMLRYARAATDRILADTGPRPDVHLAYFTLPAGEVARRGKRRLGIPYVLSLRGSDVPGHRSVGRPFRILRGMLHPWIDRVLAEADRIAPLTGQLAALAARRVGESRITTIGNGVAERFFRVPPPDDEGPFRPIWIGRIAPAKGAGLFLRALARMKRPGRPWHATVIGDGPLRRRTERLAARLGLEGSVRFLGWIPRKQMTEALSAAHLLVLSSDDEGMPAAVLEGMAAGRVIVSTRIGGVEGILRDEENALLVPPRDPEGLAAAIDRLRNDPALAARLAETARTEARTRTWEGVAEAYERLFART